MASRWEDEEAHRAYLARFSDLDGLAEAGRRYRSALESRPGDPVATRWREEVLKRATARALASMPRGSSTHPRARWVRYAGVVVAGVLLGAAAWLALSLLRVVSR
ncbi:MAG TPA: hypothetical protein VLS93_11805 [Anaeromyxobacteraceae bacterium]|nr:hypothetical protein [Anaeromyxobacteraceae bacterium]